MAETTSGAAKVTLPADDEILITREFRARPHLVYRAWTTPELVSRWWSGHRGTLTSAEIDLRIGGRWRYVILAASGPEVAFHGEYREIVPDERLVTTEVFEMPGVPEPTDPPVTTTTFAASGTGTLLSMLTRTGSRELRDTILASGMETGMQEQLALLDDLAAELA